MIGLFIQRAVYQPVRVLAKATTRVAAGNFDHSIPSRAHDEIGQLAESFNKMTQRLRTVQYQLLQSEKLASIGKLAATIAHEINNPLNGILTYTKLIERKLAGGSLKEDEIPKLRSNLAIMERETERCSSIVRNLLDFARQREPSLRPDVDINGVVDEALSLLANQIALQEITLEKRYAELPHVMADPRQLRQAFLNIILNSCEAMQTGGKLTITTAFSRKDQTVKLEITDNGAGIPKEDIPKIFDPFFTSKEKGTGLGLSVVYGIITSHQGTIDVKSTVGQGTTITLRLPTEIKLSEQDSVPEQQVEKRQEKAFMPR